MSTEVATGTHKPFFPDCFIKLAFFEERGGTIEVLHAQPLLVGVRI